MIENYLRKRDEEAAAELARIGDAIGYGNAQHILGELWDAMLLKEYGISGRGAMGVTVDDALPPIPKPAALRRRQSPHGGYEMVPAYSVDELKRFAHAAIAKSTGSDTTARRPQNDEAFDAEDQDAP